MRTKAKRIVACVNPSFLVEGKGYRVSLVVEGEEGHHPTGTWPLTGAPEEKMPWFWGPTLDDAQAACDQHNESLGISREEAFTIVGHSMSSQSRRRA